MRKPIKICQVITELAPAGAERCVYELARGLNGGEFEIHVAALRGGEVADKLQAAGITTHILDMRSKLDLRRAMRLIDIFRDGAFDIVHTHLFHAGMLGRFAARRAGIAHILHSEHIDERRRLPWRCWWARLTASQCERIICVSREVMLHQSGQCGLDQSRYTVIYNGINTEQFRPNENYRRQIRDELQIADDEILCAFLGRLDIQKGLDTLLTGFTEAAARSQAKLRLAVAGQGNLQPMLDSAAKAAGGKILPLGFRRDAEKLLNAADICCMPSNWEGFGLSAAEAMACEKPLVASKIGGLGEISADENCCIQIAPGDSDALAEAIVKLAGDTQLRSSLGKNARRRVEENFSMEAFLQNHRQLYLDTAANKNIDKTGR